MSRQLSPSSAVRIAALSAIAVLATVAAPCVAELGAVSAIERTRDGVLVKCGGGLVRLQVWSDSIVRVQSTEAAAFSGPAVTAVLGHPAKVQFEILEADGYFSVKTRSIEARVDRASAAVSFIDNATGKAFLAEQPGGRAATSTQVKGQAVHGSSLTFVRQPDEAIIGLGQHQDGLFNYRDAHVQLLQKNTDIGVPVLTSSAGYLLLWDNAAVTTIDTSANQVNWSSESGDTVDYYVCYGPDLDAAVSGYRSLTGDAPMFGRWAWGLWQSRERYVTQQETLDIAKQYRERKIPIDGIVQDWQYWYPQPWGSHAFGTNFPDPGGLVKQLHEMNLHTIISVWAKFDQGSKNYDEMESAGNLFPPVYPNVYPKGNAKWYDAFKPEARQMYWRQMNEQIGVYGWDGWWLDATEPELGGKWGELRELKTAAGPGYAVFNAYPLMTTTGVYEGQKARKPEVRPFILTRSAYAGQQRNGAVAWSGDVAGNWQVFKKQIPAGLNFVATGIPYWNTDTGGFFGGSPDDPEYRELFTRWFQFSTFCPMLRIHGTGAHKPLWAFGPETQKTLETFNNLRYRLIPYIYSMSWQVTKHRASMMRPLVFDYADDPNVHDIGDQFLFGPGLMVCPVTEPAGGNLALIPSESLIDEDGKPGGLSAVYYQGHDFEKEIARRVDASIDFDWEKVKREGVGANPRTDPIPGLAMDHFSVRWQGAVQTQRAGTYTFRIRGDDGFRLFVDGKLLAEDWRARSAVTKTATIQLPANARVPIKVEYFQDINPATVDLRWQPPTDGESAVFTRKVYLPKGDWFDFWTGERLPGGRTIDAAAPIERLPLFIKAGTILPMGPVVQFASERPDAPLELRVYPGADADFTLYDDVGDGYAYERGEFTEIPLHWDDKSRTLSLHKRQGAYAGMPTSRKFKAVLVRSGRGVGTDETRQVDREITFDGNEMSISCD